jgi:hypothetical protein
MDVVGEEADEMEQESEGKNSREAQTESLVPKIGLLK